MRWIHDRRRQQRSERAAIGDGERAALQIVEGEAAFARLFRVVRDRLFDLREAHGLRVAQHRRDQTLVGRDRDRDVLVAMVDHVAAVDRRVDDRITLQRLACGFHEEAHVAELDPIRLFKLFAESLAHCGNLAKVDLVERGQHRNRVLRQHQALGDLRAHACHRHAFLGARRPWMAKCRECRMRWSGRARRRCRGGFWCRCTGAHEVDQIFLGHAAIAAGRWHVCRIDLVLGRDALAGRRKVGSGACFCRSGASRDGRCSGLGGRGRGWRRSYSFRFLRRSGGAFLNDREQLLAGHRGTGVLFDFLENAIGRRRHFEHDLVGFKVDEIFVALDRVARLLVPGSDGRVGNGLGQHGDFDFDHGVVLGFCVRP